MAHTNFNRDFGEPTRHHGIVDHAIMSGWRPDLIEDVARARLDARTRARYEAQGIVLPGDDPVPTMAKDAAERKNHPLATGLLDYFPAALAEVSHVSKVGNDQHNPGQPMHWAREKSVDHADTIIRHLADRGLIDSDGLRHSAKVAWRALALLQEELERDGYSPGRASRFASED